MSDPAAPIETELKLALTPEAAERLRRSQALRQMKSAPGARQRLFSVYFDTPDRKLRRQEMSLRVRHVGKRRVQTFKTGTKTAGLLARHEWETDVTADAPDLAQLAEPAKIAGLNGGDELVPVFATDIKRTAWRLRSPDGSEIELVLDCGEIATSEAKRPICEAEIELKSGEPARLFELAVALRREVPFRLEPRSKAHRGYALASGEEGRAAKAGVLELSADMDVEAALKAIGRYCLRHLELNEECAVNGDSPEGVHQVRVATRRLRSALTLFKAFLPPVASELAAELRWFANQCGPARDWDVFLADVARPLRQQLPHEPALQALEETAALQRGLAYIAVRDAIQSERFTALKLRLAQWLVEPWLTPANGAAPPWRGSLSEFADRLLHKRSRRLRRDGNRIAELGAAELHEVRIRAKKLRYAVEFFRGLYRRKMVNRHVEALAAIQEALGAANDAAVGRRLIDQIGTSAMAAPWQPRALGLVEGWYAARLHTLQPRLPLAMQSLKRVKRYWAKPDQAREEPSLPGAPIAR